MPTYRVRAKVTALASVLPRQPTSYDIDSMRRMLENALPSGSRVFEISARLVDIGTFQEKYIDWNMFITTSASLAEVQGVVSDRLRAGYTALFKIAVRVDAIVEPVSGADVAANILGRKEIAYIIGSLSTGFVLGLLGFGLFRILGR